MLSDALIEKLEAMRSRCAELERLLATPETASDPGRLRAVTKEFGSLAKFVRPYEDLRQLQERRRETANLLESDGDDPELRELAREELAELEKQIEQAETQLRELFATDDQDSTRDVIMEIRAGAGGEEAALFAADLFRMYQKYAERKGWRTEVLQAHPTDLGGFREIIFSVEGEDVFKHLKHESGVHRVQRILDDFHAGRQSRAQFWIEMGGQFISIEYFALRDAEGGFLGTLEVSQNLTEKRALSGERRLLMYDDADGKGASHDEG